MDLKLWYQSKTIWINIGLAVMGIGTLVADALTKDPHMTASGIILLVVGGVGIVVRLFTDTAIATTPAEVAQVKAAVVDNPEIPPVK
jgi:hypothetical protein